MAQHLTIHARLVKGCNADCSYCSSWQEEPSARMSPDDYARAISFLKREVFPAMGAGGAHATVTVQYVGGEILLYPMEELRECVEMARRELYETFGTVNDGVQSNLVGSERRVLFLDRLFGGNVGTSVDGRGVKRTVRGSPEAYRKAVERSRAVLEARRGRRPGAVFVVDRDGAGNAVHEVETADARGYPLVLRPAFAGGRDDDSPDRAALRGAMTAAFDRWAMKARVPVEPFMHLATRRLMPGAAVGHACPFMRNCARTSINLDPDGSLYTCFEMADAGQMKFGNALEGVFDRAMWEEIEARIHRTDPKCAACPYFDACQGGCMSEALHHTGSIYGRTEFCEVWTDLFERIDALAARHGADEVRAWLTSLERPA